MRKYPSDGPLIRKHLLGPNYFRPEDHAEQSMLPLDPVNTKFLPRRPCRILRHPVGPRRDILKDGRLPIRNYYDPRKPDMKKQEVLGFSAHPKSVLRRCRSVLLQDLPLNTQAKDIIRAIHQAVVEEGKLSDRADQIEDVQIRPKVDDPNRLAATINFWHPDGAQTVHDLVAKGAFRVNGEVLVASFVEGVPRRLPTSNTPIGAVGQREDRVAYFNSPEERKIARRTPLIYNRIPLIYH